MGEELQGRFENPDGKAGFRMGTGFVADGERYSPVWIFGIF